MRSKYKSKSIVVDGISFDSKEEARYYEYLKKLKAQDKIQNFELQPKLILIESFKYFGKTERSMTYTPDFLIYHVDGSTEYVDVKGYSTQQGEIRKKLFKYRYRNSKLTWVASNYKWGNEYGWIEYGQLQKIRRNEKKRKELKRNA